MNGYLVKVVATLSVAGVLGAVGVYAKQGRIDERVVVNKEEILENGERIEALEKRQEEALREQRDMFREILRRLPDE